MEEKLTTDFDMLATQSLVWVYMMELVLQTRPEYLDKIYHVGKIYRVLAGKRPFGRRDVHGE